MTLGLPPAGIFWQPSGGSPSLNLLPSPRRFFVPGSCSAHLGASIRGGQHRGSQPLRLTLRPSGYCPCPPSPVGAAEPRNPSLPPAARTPSASLAPPQRPQPSAPGFSFGPFFLGLAMVCLVRKLQQMEKSPSLLSLLYPREEKDLPFVFDSCPTLHYPVSSRGRKQPLWIPGAGHCRKSIRDKNQLLPE